MRNEKLLNTFEYLRNNVKNQKQEVSVDYIIDLKNGKWIAHQDIEEWHEEYLNLDDEVETILNEYSEKDVDDKDIDILKKDTRLSELYEKGYINMYSQVYVISFEDYCLVKANKMAEE